VERGPEENARAEARSGGSGGRGQLWRSGPGARDAGAGLWGRGGAGGAGGGPAAGEGAARGPRAPGGRK
jgi:hypothetical protein